MLTIPALAQEKSEEKIPCQPYGSIPADSDVKYIMSDINGNWWLHIRTRNTGIEVIGVLKRPQNIFCPLAIGKTNPEL